MENVVVKDAILDKKLESYCYHNKDFVAQGEITVEITLNEYRELIKDSVTASIRIDEANKDKYNREAENESLKKQVEILKAENYELKKVLDTIKGEVDDGGNR